MHMKRRRGLWEWSRGSEVRAALQDDVSREQLMFIAKVMLFLASVVYIFSPSLPFYSWHSNLVFHDRLAFRPVDHAVESTKNAFESLSNFDKITDEVNRYDICPIILITNKEEMAWLWLVHAFYRPDLDSENVKQATIGPISLFWTPGDTFVNLLELKPDLLDSLTRHDVIVPILFEASKQDPDYEEHVTAWTTCSDMASKCRTCLVVEDMFQVTDSNLRRGLYEILALAGRVNWGIVTLTPNAIRLDPYWTRFVIYVIVIMLIYRFVCVVISSIPHRVCLTIAFVLTICMALSIVVWLNAWRSIIPPPEVTSMSDSSETPWIAYLIKPEDGLSLIRGISTDVKHDFGIVEAMKRVVRLSNRADLTIMTASLVTIDMLVNQDDDDDAK